MTIQLELTAQLKLAAGTARTRLELPAACRLREALQAAAALHGDDVRRLLVTSTGLPQPTLLLFHCDQPVPAGADPALVDGDTVTVMMPISGG